MMLFQFDYPPGESNDIIIRLTIAVVGSFIKSSRDKLRNQVCNLLMKILG